MAEATITSKGQITIPAEIRKRMNLGPQDRVVFTMLPNGTTLMRAKNRSVTLLAGAIAKPRSEVHVVPASMERACPVGYVDTVVHVVVSLVQL